MKRRQPFPLVPLFPFFLFVILACSLPSLPSIQIPSLQTRAASSATASGDSKIGKGPTVASAQTAQDILEKDSNIQILEQLAKESYNTDDLSQAGKTYTFTISINKEQNLVMLNGWCATTEAILRDNFKHITMEFSINGTPIDDKLILVSEREDSGELFCRSFFVVRYEDQRWHG
ncbi:MAG: lipocalin/fatty-acid binding family protein [Chloroflexi bacterium]|nr:lipocalin/fatty-acid binding family protein [Chloroflexota bacterium]